MHPGERIVLTCCAVQWLAGCSAPLQPRPIDETLTGASLATDRNGDPETARNPKLSGFYPLAIGNRWEYRARFTAQVIPDQGPPEPASRDRSTIGRELVCIEQREGRDYFVEHGVERSLSDSYHSWVRYRQDASGLYEADVATRESAPCAGAPAVALSDRRGTTQHPAAAAALAGLDPDRRDAYWQAWTTVERKLAALRTLRQSLEGTGSAGPFPGEITRLDYPLEPGATWVIRDLLDVRWVSTVEDVEMLRLPAGHMRGFRIRIDIPPLTGPNDRIHVWYGAQGFLKLRAHLEGTATNEQGEPIGVVVGDDLEELTDLELGDSIRF